MDQNILIKTTSMTSVEENRMKQATHAQHIWLAAYVRALKKNSPKKAAVKADGAVAQYENRWRDSPV
jgi:hypothetical protein